jgi:hypothetical protein
MNLSPDTLQAMLLVWFALEIFPWIVFGRARDKKYSTEAAMISSLTLLLTTFLVIQLGFAIEQFLSFVISLGLQKALALSPLSYSYAGFYISAYLALFVVLAVSSGDLQKEKLLRGFAVASAILVIRDWQVTRGKLEAENLISSLVIGFLLAVLIISLEKAIINTLDYFQNRKPSGLTSNIVKPSNKTVFLVCLGTGSFLLLVLIPLFISYILAFLLLMSILMGLLLFLYWKNLDAVTQLSKTLSSISKVFLLVVIVFYQNQTQVFTWLFKQQAQIQQIYSEIAVYFKTTYSETGHFEIGGAYIYNWNSGAWVSDSSWSWFNPQAEDSHRCMIDNYAITITPADNSLNTMNILSEVTFKDVVLSPNQFHAPKEWEKVSDTVYRFTVSGSGNNVGLFVKELAVNPQNTFFSTSKAFPYGYGGYSLCYSDEKLKINLVNFPKDSFYQAKDAEIQRTTYLDTENVSLEIPTQSLIQIAYMSPPYNFFRGILGPFATITTASQWFVGTIGAIAALVIIPVVSDLLKEKFKGWLERKTTGNLTEIKATEKLVKKNNKKTGKPRK